MHQLCVRQRIVLQQLNKWHVLFVTVHWKCTVTSAVNMSGELCVLSSVSQLIYSLLWRLLEENSQCVNYLPVTSQQLINYPWLKLPDCIEVSFVCQVSTFNASQIIKACWLVVQNSSSRTIEILQSVVKEESTATENIERQQDPRLRLQTSTNREVSGLSRQREIWLCPREKSGERNPLCLNNGAVRPGQIALLRRSPF